MVGREKQTKYVLTAEDRTRMAVDSASRGLAQLDARVLGLGSALKGLAGVASVGMFASLLKSSIDTQDQLGKMSAKVGVSVESLSALKYAGELADVTLEDMGTGLRQLAKNAQDTAANLGEGRYAFDALGIAVKDSNGHLKGTEPLLLEVANKFAGMEDGAGKTALAMRLFGRSGADLIPLLNQGAAGIAATTEEARRLGVVFSDEATKAAEEFNDNLTRLKATTEGLAAALSGNFVLAVDKAGEAMLRARHEGDGFFSTLAKGWQTLVTGTDAFKAHKQLADLGDELVRLQDQLDLAKRSDAGDYIIKGVEANIARVQAQMKTLIGITPLLEGQPLGGAPGGPPGKKTKAPNLIDPAERERLRKAAQAAQTQQDLQAANPYVLAAQQEAAFNAPGKLEAQLAGVEKMNEEQEKAAQKLKDQVQPLRDINRERELAVKLYKEGKVTAEELAARQAQLDDEAATALGNQVDKVKEATSAAKDFGLVMQSAASDAIRNWQGFSNLLKSIITDFAQVEFKKYALDPIMKSAGGIFDSVLGGLFGGGGGAASAAEEASALVGGGGFATGIPYVPREGLYKLHAGEKVSNATDSKKAGGGGPQVFIDARGADAAAVARLESLVRRLDGTFNQRAVAAVGDARRRGVNLTGG